MTTLTPTPPKLATIRWQHEHQRAAAAGLLTTTQAAHTMGVPTHTIRRWAALGLLTNRGTPGKGHPALWDPDELHTAPHRRQHRTRGTCSHDDCSRPHLAKGFCTRHYRRWRRHTRQETQKLPAKAERNAVQTLRRGGTLRPPRSLPYHSLAVSCPRCGLLRTTPDHLLHRDTGRIPRCLHPSGYSAALHTPPVKQGHDRGQP